MVKPGSSRGLWLWEAGSAQLQAGSTPLSLVSFSLREGSVQESTSFVSLTPPPQGLGILWTPPVGEPGFTVRKKVWPHAPGVGTSPAGETSTGEPAKGCSPPVPRAICLTTAGWLAPLLQPLQCHQALGGAWQEGTEHVLGSCASPRRSSLQTGKPQGGYWLPAVSLGGQQATGGVLTAPAPTLGPSSLCQPMPPNSKLSASLSVPKLYGVRWA